MDADRSRRVVSTRATGRRPGAGAGGGALGERRERAGGRGDPCGEAALFVIRDLTPTAPHELRTEMLQAGLSRLEPGQAGRPPKRTDEEAAEVAALKRENQELKVDLQASRLREEIAIAMPGLLDKSVSAGLQKKRPAKPQG